MKDIVLQGFVQNFSEEHGFQNMDPSIVFEAFSISSILRKYHQIEASDIEDFLTGGGGDGGIDAAAILVNGHPARTKEDVDFFIDKLNRLDVEFVFVQSKMSPSFESASIGTFTHGVEQFFAYEPYIEFRGELERLRLLKDYIYTKSIKMHQTPHCHLYYVSTGKWNDDVEPRSRFESSKLHLNETELFSTINTAPIDAEQLKYIYRELERGITKQVDFGKIAVFPQIEGVREAYIGLLSGDQFIRLITTDEGQLNRDLFYDNVRDFQGRNPVNREIEQTVQNENSRGMFPLLNNGVTIVARSINRVGDSFKIEDFQIVNGCQTSNVLFQNIDAIDSSVFIPVKLVVTDDSDVITEVIKATNRQTAVHPEALESLSPFHKELEDFYNTQEHSNPKEHRIYYERRSKQYAFDRIKPSNIVSLTAQTKSFVAMFLNEPHSQHRYYGELLKSYQTRLYVPDHNPAAYFLSGYCLLAVERLFNKGKLKYSMKRWKYHILMLLRLQIGGDMPQLNSKKMTDYSLNIVNELRDENRCFEASLAAMKIITQELQKHQSLSITPTRLRAFTTQLRNAVHESSTATAVPNSITEPNQISSLAEPIVGSIERGAILWYDEWKGYGFIEREDGGENIFVYRDSLRNVPWHLLRPGTKVSYKVDQGPKSLAAFNVEVMQ